MEIFYDEREKKWIAGGADAQITLTSDDADSTGNVWTGSIAPLLVGKYSDAAATLNQLRQRAQASYMLTESDLSGEDGIYTILAERTRELSWEEHRWPQLLRMAKSGTENKVMHHQLLNHAMYIAEVPYYDASKGIPWSLFPIPWFIMQSNDEEHQWTQNPGWD